MHRTFIWGMLWQRQVSRPLTSNHIPQILWDVINWSCPWYLLLAQHSSSLPGSKCSLDYENGVNEKHITFDRVIFIMEIHKHLQRSRSWNGPSRFTIWTQIVHMNPVRCFMRRGVYCVISIPLSWFTCRNVAFIAKKIKIKTLYDVYHGILPCQYQCILNLL